MSIRVTPTTMNRNVMSGPAGQPRPAAAVPSSSCPPGGGSTARPTRRPTRPRRCGCAASRRGPSSSGATSTTGSPGSGSADSTMTQASSFVLRVRQLLVAGQNGTNGPTERGAMAGEVDELRPVADRAGQHAVPGTSHLCGDAECACGLRHDDRGLPGERRRRAAQRLRRRRRRRWVSPSPAPRCSARCSRGPAPTPVCSPASPPPCSSGDTAGDEQGARRPRPGVRRPCRTPRAWSASRYNRLLGVQTRGEAQLDTVSASLATAENIDLPKTIIDMQTAADRLPGRARLHRQDHPALARRLPALTRTPCADPSSALTRPAVAASCAGASPGGEASRAASPAGVPSYGDRNGPRIPQVRSRAADEGGGQDDHLLPRTGGAPSRTCGTPHGVLTQSVRAVEETPMPEPVGDATMSALHYALSGLALRQRTIADNTANIETPGLPRRQGQLRGHAAQLDRRRQ